jgi:hypothetical protein
MSSLLERTPKLEEHLGVSFSGLYAYGLDDYIHVNGEMRSTTGDVLSDGVEIVVNLYDAGSRILGSMRHLVNAETFFGFESFALSENLDEDQAHVTRILVSAKRW